MGEIELTTRPATKWTEERKITHEEKNESFMETPQIETGWLCVIQCGPIAPNNNNICDW